MRLVSKNMPTPRTKIGNSGLKWKTLSAIRICSQEMRIVVYSRSLMAMEDDTWLITAQKLSFASLAKKFRKLNLRL